MPTPGRISTLIKLLREQRRLIAVRAALPRNSAEFTEATHDLDEINQQIMLVAGAGSTTREDVGAGITLALDSRPQDDPEFRASVVDSVQRAISAAARDHLMDRAEQRLATSQQLAARTDAVIAAAQASLRRLYPGATLDRTDDEEPGDEALSVLAEREGRIA